MKIMINEHQMTDKQQCIALAGAIKNNSKNGYKTHTEELTIEELADRIKAGHTIVPGLLDESKKLTGSTWSGQQVFALDFDNSTKVNGQTRRVEDKYYMSFERIMQICEEREVMPCIVYETFSSSEQIRKYRVIFINDAVITYKHASAAIQNNLASMFNIEGVATTDIQCSDLGRMFFAGKEILHQKDNYMHIENKPSFADLISEPIEAEKVDKNAGKKQRKTLRDNANSHEEFSGIHKMISSYVCSKNPTHIKALNANALRAILGEENVTFCSESEAINYIQTEVDMAEFLGIQTPKSFCCIVHEDEKPSAGILRGDNGVQWYHCFACGFKGDLIAVIAELQACSRAKAIRFIKEVLNIKVEIPESVLTAQENITENMRMIMDGEIKEVFPITHSIIRRYQQDLLLLHALAKENIGITGNGDDKHIMFFVSQTHMAKLLQTHQANTSKRAATFSFLKLIEKVDDADVPEDMLTRAQSIAARKQVRDTVQFYRIPSYTWKALRETDQMAKLWKENAGTMAGMSREWIYRTFGAEEADRVYPKRKGLVPTNNSDKFQAKLEKQLVKIIDSRGYAKESDVLEKMMGTKEINQERIKRILAETLKNLSLQRVRANKDLKEQYAIKSNGYPFILIRK